MNDEANEYEKGLDDFVSEKFKRHSKDAKRISLPSDWKTRSDPDKIKYLIKLASALNEACQIIQGERDEANNLLFLKENNIVNLTARIQQMQIWVHGRMDAENKTKNAQAAHILKLKQTIRDMRQTWRPKKKSA